MSKLMPSMVVNAVSDPFGLSFLVLRAVRTGMIRSGVSGSKSGSRNVTMIARRQTGSLPTPR